MEEARDFLFGGLDLGDGVEAVLAWIDGAFGFDDDDGNAVQKDDHVRDSGFVALDAELTHGHPIVVLGMLEVHQVDRAMGGFTGKLARIASTKILEPFFVVVELGELFVDRQSRLQRDVVEITNRLHQNRFEQHFVLAFSIGNLDRVAALIGLNLQHGLVFDPAIPHPFQEMEDGQLDEGFFVGVAHGLTRTLPVRRS